VYADENGSYFSTRDEAVDHARTIARELAVDSTWMAFAILVQDEEGNEIARIRIANHA
jgi:hypothetical protein